MSVSIIKILFVLALIAHTGFALECEVCAGKSCIGSRNCDYLTVIDPNSKLHCFTHEGKKYKGCIEICDTNMTGFECCDTDNCNSAPFSEMTTTLNPLDIEFPLSCEVCSGSTCIGSKSCSYLPVTNKEWGKKVCFISKVYNMRGCVQELGCSEEGVDCCDTDNCNSVTISKMTTLSPPLESTLSCHYCSGSKCSGSKICSLPTRKSSGRKVCYTMKEKGIRGCIYEGARCGLKNVDCCDTDNCNAP